MYKCLMLQQLLRIVFGEAGCITNANTSGARGSFRCQTGVDDDTDLPVFENRCQTGLELIPDGTSGNTIVCFL